MELTEEYINTAIINMLNMFKDLKENMNISSVQSLSRVQLFATPWTHGILQARILEWVAFPFSRGSS